MSHEKIHCLRCKHYYSTYDQNAPRACRAYGFRSSSIPAQVVKRETGSDCLHYAPKQVSKQKQSINLNDPKLW